MAEPCAAGCSESLNCRRQREDTKMQDCCALLGFCQVAHFFLWKGGTITLSAALR